MPLKQLRTALLRARAQRLPPVPSTLKGLARILEKPGNEILSATEDQKDSVFAGTSGKAREKTFSIIFASKRRLRYMAKDGCKLVFSDGTFKPVPRKIKAHQIWTISTARQNHVRIQRFCKLGLETLCRYIFIV